MSAMVEPSFPYLLPVIKETAMVRALESALELSPDLPEPERAHLQTLLGRHRDVLDYIDRRPPDVSVVDTPYQRVRDGWSGLTDMVRGATKATSHPLAPEAKKLYDAIFKEDQDQDPEKKTKDNVPFLKRPAVDLWSEGEKRLRLIRKVFAETVHRLGFDWMFEDLLANQEALGKALHITERKAPPRPAPTLKDLRKRVYDAGRLYVKGVEYWGLGHPEFLQQANLLLAPLTEFKRTRLTQDSQPDASSKSSGPSKSRASENPKATKPSSVLRGYAHAANDRPSVHQTPSSTLSESRPPSGPSATAAKAGFMKSVESANTTPLSASRPPSVPSATAAKAGLIKSVESANATPSALSAPAPKRPPSASAMTETVRTVAQTAREAARTVEAAARAAEAIVQENMRNTNRPSAVPDGPPPGATRAK